MTYSFRRGAIVTFVRDDGQSGPGESYSYKASDPAPSMALPWHRIWEVRALS
jgi:hypothetical protein